MAAPLSATEFGQDEALAWFKEAIKDGGALRKELAGMVREILKEEMMEGADTNTAISTTVDLKVSIATTAVEGKADGLAIDTQDLQKRVRAREKDEEDRGERFPWRKFESERDPQDWLAAWNSIFFSS